MVLTPEGFYDYSSALATKDKIIPWEWVEKIQEQQMVGQRLVSIYLIVPVAFLSQLSAFQRKAIQANVKLGFGEINITLQSAKSCTNSDLITKMISCHATVPKDLTIN
ncbi:hypothetical protein RyT2_06000 [Pseudolactococcus yaeyamensis]